jgi:hypothetical protein
MTRAPIQFSEILLKHRNSRTNLFLVALIPSGDNSSKQAVEPGRGPRCGRAAPVTNVPNSWSIDLALSIGNKCQTIG